VKYPASTSLVMYPALTSLVLSLGLMAKIASGLGDDFIMNDSFLFVFMILL
jgi:hypothetical protein